MTLTTSQSRLLALLTDHEALEVHSLARSTGRPVTSVMESAFRLVREGVAECIFRGDDILVIRRDKSSVANAIQKYGQSVKARKPKFANWLT